MSTVGCIGSPGRFCDAEDGIKRHPAVASHQQPRPVILVALLEDHAFTAYVVARHAVQLDSCVRRGDPGKTGVSVHLKRRLADADGLTVTMGYVAHRVRFGT